VLILFFLFKEKTSPYFKWIVPVPSLSEKSTVSGAEHFSYLYREALKNFILLLRKNKGTPLLNAPLFFIATKLIYHYLAQCQN
jgi:hypothetical protein